MLTVVHYCSPIGRSVCQKLNHISSVHYVVPYAPLAAAAVTQLVHCVDRADTPRIGTCGPWVWNMTTRLRDDQYTVDCPQDDQSPYILRGRRCLDKTGNDKTGRQW